MFEPTQPVLTQPFVLYQSTRLSAYAERLIHGFTGKPMTLGGPDFSPELVQGNRLSVCRHLGMNHARLTLPRQTHTDRFRINDNPCEDAADAVILTEPGIPAMVQVADCVPVILYEPVRHVGAVIHSGWRGTAQAIVPKVVQSLVHEHRADPRLMIGVIGPSIGGCCYEVSDEVANAVADTIPSQPKSAFSTLQDNGKPCVDLKSVIRLQLHALGLEQLETLPVCTLCETDQLWSYRRGENGRQVAFLQLQP